MCGITGFVNFQEAPKGALLAQAEAMADTLSTAGRTRARAGPIRTQALLLGIGVSRSWSCLKPALNQWYRNRAGL